MLENPSTTVEMTTLPERISPARRRISAMVAGDALIAVIMFIKPPSMRLAISISPSRVSNSTVPISRMYMRTGSVVRPNSLSTVESAASAASSASSSVEPVGALSVMIKDSASGVCS